MARNKIKSKTELFKEYNKYVASINRQLKSLEKKVPDSVAISRYKGVFSRLKSTKELSRQDIVKAHAKARELAESGRLDVNLVNREMLEAINTFQSWGYTGVNQSNINQVLEYLDSLRQKGLVAVGGSKQAFRKLRKDFKSGKISDTQLQEMLKVWLDENNKR